jgi:hypothetical protein
MRVSMQMRPGLVCDHLGQLLALRSVKTVSVNQETQAYSILRSFAPMYQCSMSAFGDLAPINKGNIRLKRAWRFE